MLWILQVACSARLWNHFRDSTRMEPVVTTHDFRTASASFLILRMVILLLFLNRHNYPWISSGQCVLLAGVSCFYAITRPY